MRRTVSLTLWPPRLPAANPVLVRELRGRFRGREAFIVLTLAQLAMLLLVLLALRSLQGYGNYYGNPTSVPGAMFGQTILSTLAFTLLFIVSVIAPGLSFNTISGEKERRTWDLLVATPLALRSIVRGKYLAALAYVALLAFSALPFFSLAFLFGGITPWRVLNVTAILLSAGALYAAVALFVSTVVGRTGRAAVVSFLSVVLVTFAPFWLAWLFEILGDVLGVSMGWDWFFGGDTGLACLWPIARLFGVVGGSSAMDTRSLGIVVVLGTHLACAEALMFGAAGNIRAQLEGRRGMLAGFGWLAIVAIIWGIAAVLMQMIVTATGSC